MFDWDNKYTKDLPINLPIMFLMGRNILPIISRSIYRSIFQGEKRSTDHLPIDFSIFDGENISTDHLPVSLPIDCFIVDEENKSTDHLPINLPIDVRLLMGRKHVPIDLKIDLLINRTPGTNLQHSISFIGFKFVENI